MTLGAPAPKPKKIPPGQIPLGGSQALKPTTIGLIAVGSLLAVFVAYRFYKSKGK